MLYVVFSYVATKKEQLMKSCSFLCFYQILEEDVVNFMDEMLTEEGDTTMHNDED